MLRDINIEGKLPAFPELIMYLKNKEHLQKGYPGVFSASPSSPAATSPFLEDTVHSCSVTHRCRHVLGCALHRHTETHACSLSTSSVTHRHDAGLCKRLTFCRACILFLAGCGFSYVGLTQT